MYLHVFCVIQFPTRMMISCPWHVCHIGHWPAALKADQHRRQRVEQAELVWETQWSQKQESYWFCNWLLGFIILYYSWVFYCWDLFLLGFIIIVFFIHVWGILLLGSIIVGIYDCWALFLLAFILVGIYYCWDLLLLVVLIVGIYCCWMLLGFMIVIHLCFILVSWLVQIYVGIYCCSYWESTSFFVVPTCRYGGWTATINYIDWNSLM